jgi:DNA-binding SARP family transcriptional activator/tetratricopeptide (TPR) repeat protein
MATLAVGLLGRFDVGLDGRSVDLPSGPQRAALAALALAAPRTVSPTRLAELTSIGPADSRPDVEIEVRRLQSALGDEVVRSDPGGWRLDIEPSDVDATRFTRLVSTALRAPGWTSTLLTDALALWRGEPFTGVDAPVLERAHRPGLVESRLLAVERLADVELAGGHPDAQLPLLRELAEQHPLRESLWARLVAALLESGRATEALIRFQQIQRCLTETLGDDPGPDLERLHRRIRENNPAAAALTVSARPRPLPPFRPRRDLPPRPTGFVGRSSELVMLNERLGDHDLAPSRAQTVCTIYGPGGVGKTALALEWAHQVADRFPDGQLYLNLRGYGLVPTHSSTAFASVLRAVGVPDDQIHADPAAQTAMLRNRLAGRRMLILLDDVRDADQIRALLPGAHCLILVTSRHPLPSLADRDGARQLGLAGLDVSEARELLATELPPDRLTAEPDAVARITDRCHGLPLALWVVAERLAADPQTSLAHLADELTVTDAPPAMPKGEDVVTADVDAVLSWAVERLDPQTATVFRRLGLHPSGEFSTDSAAALLGMANSPTRRELDRLVLARLLEPCGRGRYRLHDVVQRLAVALAADVRPLEAVEAVRRVVDWCLYSVANANEALGAEPGIALAESDSGLTPTRFRSPSEVTRWFEAERDLLVAAVLAATEHEMYRQGHQLAYLLRALFRRQRRFEEYVHVAELGVECARYLDDEAVARALRTLGQAYGSAARTEEAATSLQEAVSYAARTGDLGPVAIAISGLGVDAGRAGDQDAALRHHQQAVDASRRSNDPRLLGSTLLNLGFTQIEAEDYDHGIATTQEALRLFVESGAETEAAWALGNLAQALRRIGQPDSAIELAERALPTLRRLGDVEATAEVLITLGRALQDTGRDDEAAELVGSDHPLTPEIKDLLATLGTGPTPLAPGGE